MQLISPVAAGIYGAENGTVNVFRRGTSLRIPVYSDFEGTDVLPSGPVELDANGGASLYVSELATVRVVDSSGALIREFVAGNGDASTEVRSQSFTGRDYETGLAGTGKPTTVRAVADKWLDSAGAPDWLVATSTGNQRIQDIVAAFSKIYFNVKDAEYGAIGDGSAVDTTAVQAAADAAEAAGGGVVFFPPGTYRLGDITLGEGVSVLGCGAGATTLVFIGLTTGKLFTVDSTITVTLESFKASAQAASDVSIIYHDNGARIRVRNCVFDGNLTSESGVVRNNTTGEIWIEDTYIAVTASNASSLVNGSSGIIRATACNFKCHTTGASQGMVLGRNIFLNGCYFDQSEASSGTIKCVAYDSTICGYAIGCHFSGTAGATSTLFYIDGIGANNEFFQELGNIYPTDSADIVPYYFASDATDAYHAVFGSRDGKFNEETNADGSHDLDPTAYAVTTLNMEFAGNLSINFTKLAPPGTKFSLILINNDASNRTVTWGTNVAGKETVVLGNSLLGTQGAGCEFVSGYVDTGAGLVLGWYMVGVAAGFYSIDEAV